MELSFLTRQLREFCIQPFVDRLAQDDVDDLVALLADFMAADCLGEVPWDVVYPAADPAEVSVEVNDRWVLLGRLDHVPQPRGDIGVLSSRIRIDELRRKDGET